MATILRLMMLTIILVFTSSCYAKNTKEFQSYVPRGWKLVANIKGNLQGNSKEDAVLILEKNDPANYQRNTVLGPDTLNLNPRRLLILFKTSNGYKKILSNDTFIPSANSEDYPCSSDPFDDLDDGIEISSKRHLVITFDEDSTCGGWSAGTDTFIFRYDAHKKDFRLIGQERFTYIKNGGKETYYSLNYLTGKIEVTEYLDNEDDSKDSKPKIRWLTIKDNKLHYLSSIANQNEFNKYI